MRGLVKSTIGKVIAGKVNGEYQIPCNFILNKDFLVNLILVLFDIITVLVLVYIFIINISSALGLCTLLFLYFRIRYLIHDLYCLVCENYKAP